MTPKLAAGSPFPETRVQILDGGEIDLAVPSKEWRMVVVYRGKHCPLCTKYLSALNDKVSDLSELGIDVVAVSSDPKEKAEAQMGLVKPSFPVGYGLTVDQMRTLGLYISEPLSDQETKSPFPEPGSPFAEPGVFIINSEGALHIVDISNAPFARPDLDSLVGGLQFVRRINYPIRGTHK